MRVFYGILWFSVESGIVCCEHGNETPFHKVREFHQISHKNIKNVPIQT